MGFRLDRTYRLIFADYPQLDGLEVSLRKTSVATTVELRELSWVKDSPRIAEMLAEHVIGWNYEDEDDKPLAPTAEAFLALEHVLFLAIVGEWYMAATGVTAPLEQTSTDTSSPDLGSVPMEAS